MSGELTREELAELRLAVEMDTEFTSRMEPGASEGPAITHHLLYVTRKYGPRLLATIDARDAALLAAEQEVERLTGERDEAMDECTGWHRRYTVQSGERQAAEILNRKLTAELEAAEARALDLGVTLATRQGAWRMDHMDEVRKLKEELDALAKEWLS